MRRITCCGLAALAGVLILHVSMAVEPTTLFDETQRLTMERSQVDSILDARVKLIEQGLAKSAPPVQPPEALLLLATLKARIEILLGSATEQHPAFAKNEPTTLDDFEKLFWSMHVFSNWSRWRLRAPRHRTRRFQIPPT